MVNTEIRWIIFFEAKDGEQVLLVELQEWTKRATVIEGPGARGRRLNSRTLEHQRIPYSQGH